MPLHWGYLSQPQNWPPAFFPCRAVRRVMVLPQSGQAGEVGAAGVGFFWTTAAGSVLGVTGVGLFPGVSADPATRRGLVCWHFGQVST